MVPSGSGAPEHRPLPPHHAGCIAGREGRSWMKVAEVMSRGVDPIDPTATVQQAARQMAEFDIGAVLIGTEERLEGILTDRDVILRVVVDGRNPAEVIVRDVMSPTL